MLMHLAPLTHTGPFILMIIFLVFMVHDVDGLMQEWHNSIANAMELRLSCTNPSMCVR